MDRVELLDKIDNSLVEHSRGELSLTDLQTEIRNVVNAYCDEIALDLRAMSKILETVEP